VKSLLDLCEPGVINKIRFRVPEPTGLVFEVDEFRGDNKGLVIAEIELPNEEYRFHRPAWLGKEVTGIAAYYNASLMKRPFKMWDDDSV
jgi:adenylate cyclase